MSPADETTRERAIQVIRDRVDQDCERLFFGTDGQLKREKKSVVKNRQNLTPYKLKQAANKLKRALK